jgi:hypothetical protein
MGMVPFAYSISSTGKVEDASAKLVIGNCGNGVKHKVTDNTPNMTNMKSFIFSLSLSRLSHSIGLIINTNSWYTMFD